MNKTINPVLQEWVMVLKWKEQTGLISAGFWCIDSSGDFYTYGRSVSLNIDSHESDSMLFKYRFDL